MRYAAAHNHFWPEVTLHGLQNEKRKDKELTERIAKILKIRDEVLREADIGMSSHLSCYVSAHIGKSEDRTLGRPFGLYTKS